MEQADGETGARLWVLEPGESVAVTVRATRAVMIVTDRRVILLVSGQRLWALGFQDLRRIQFDVERDKSTLVIVPEKPDNVPHLLALPEGELEHASQAVAIIGRHVSV
jgi:hypothetical protein